jgi:hypothetical protein
MSDDERALPGFAAARAEVERYAVEREQRPGHDGEQEHIRIRDVVGVPSSLMILVLVRAANGDGWLLDKHSDHGDDLVFVPVKDGESR